MCLRGTKITFETSCCTEYRSEITVRRVDLQFVKTKKNWDKRLVIDSCGGKTVWNSLPG